MFKRTKFTKGVKRVRRIPGVMNKTEAAYASHLQGQQLAGFIESYEFENTTFKLAKDVRYTPDFMVVSVDGYVEYHEVKAGIDKKRKVDDGQGNVVSIKTGEKVPRVMDDAKVKIVVAARLLPFIFKTVWKGADGNWQERIEGYAVIGEEAA